MQREIYLKTKREIVFFSAFTALSPIIDRYVTAVQYHWLVTLKACCLLVFSLIRKADSSHSI